MKQAYAGPPVSFLREKGPKEGHGSQIDWIEAQEVLENRTYQYGLNVKLLGAERGPTVTTYRVDIGAQKTAATKFLAMQTDLRRWFRSLKPLRIVPPKTPDGHCWEVQVANKKKETVYLREILESEEYRAAEGSLVVPIGKTDKGKILTADLAAFPHLLVAGETGSGKSVFLNVLLTGLIFRYSPEDAQLLIVDLKQVEMAQYAGLPHLLCDPLSDIPEIRNALRWLREENDRRLALFKTRHVRKIDEYNALEDAEKLPRIVAVIDDASELMSDPKGKKEMIQTVTHLARLGRASGIHIVFATQNPVKTVITSELQLNFYTKISFSVGDYVHSQAILRERGAECLIGFGDMLLRRGENTVRAQCAYVDTEEVERMTAFVKERNARDGEKMDFANLPQREDPAKVALEEMKTAFTEAFKKVPKITPKKPAEKTAGDAAKKAPAKKAPTKKAQAKAAPAAETEKTEVVAGAADEKWQALRLLEESGNASAALLQRKMKKGYNTVSKILEDLEKDGYVSAPKNGKRTLLIDKETFVKEWEKRFGPYEG